jgi:SAM-dependent methyltransferase
LRCSQPDAKRAGRTIRIPDATLIRAGGFWSVDPHWLPLLRNLIFVTDALFALPRLAEIYDLVEEERNDLDHYLAISAEFGARSVLDVGCGTGTFACLLADRGIEVVAVDPAAASLDVARCTAGPLAARRRD